MNQPSFVTANFVAKQLNYHMTAGWSQGEQATEDYFRPIDTFSARFDEMLAEIEAMGFQSLDLWLAHLNPAWATDRHLAIVLDLLRKRNMTITSFAGKFGNTPEEFEQTCKQAAVLGVSILGGRSAILEQDRSFVIKTLKNYDLRLAIENHPERTPSEIVEEIGEDSDGRIGTVVDTGWYGTHGFDAAEAIRILAPHLMHVHLKDIVAPGGHVTCRFGDGCVPLEDCVTMLKEINYKGAMSIEHEPEDYDPTEECIENLKMLREWLVK